MELHNIPYGYGLTSAEVPGELEYDFLQDYSHQQSNLYAPGVKPSLLGDSIPIIRKREDLIPESETSLSQDYSGWYPHHNPMASSPYAPEANQPLQLSQPPTPAAECQVSSTISPLNSPFTPQSDGSYSVFQPQGDPTHYEMQGQPPQEFATLAEFGEYKGMTEEQLVSLSARDLNRLCRDMSEDLVKQLKKRRRTLKNRGYAYNSRVRRVTQKNVLETERDDLKKQLSQLSERCKLLEREAEQWKRRCQTLQQSHGPSAESR